MIPSIGGIASGAALQALTSSTANGPAGQAQNPLGTGEQNALGAGEGATLAGAEGGAGLAGGEAAAGSAGTSFTGQLGQAIASLETTQQSASNASQALATGTVKDPASAVMTVEDAQLAMDLAAQIRTKATEAAQSIFQTQV